MTLTNTVVAKLVVAFVAISMVFTAFAPAQAQTAEELQATIDSLMAQINSLNSQLGVSGGDSMGSSAGVCPYSWTRSLNMGATGADVMALQQFLNASADTQVSVSGAGAPGSETSYYGPATGAAVAKFQTKYRTDILSPLNLVNPTTFFGPATMAKANALCVSAPVVDDSMDDSDDDSSDDSDDSDDNTPSDNTLRGGEADVDSFDYSDEEDEIAEGEEDVAVQTVEFDVEDGDVRLERMDIRLEFNGGGTAESDPWDAFDEISIWVDGDKVASEDVTDEDDWDEVSSTVFEFRLTNIDSVFREDTTGEVTIALSAAGNVDVDGTAGNDDWDVFVPADGMRFVDGEGLDIEGPTAAGDQARFELIEESENDDLDLDSSSEDPDATTFAVDEDDEKEYMIFAVELSAEDSDNDISLDNLYFDVEVGSTNAAYDTLNELVDDFRIEIDGDSYDAESYVGTVATQTIHFDIDGDSEVEADDVVTVKLFANFNDVANTFTSATITASIDATSADVDAEGADDLTSIGGSNRSGEVHTLRLEGVTLSSEPTDGTDDGDAKAITSGVATDDDYGTFFLEFDITVFGDDLWVPINSVSRGASTTAGVAFVIENSVGTTITTGTTSVDFDIDGATEDNGYYELEEGNTYSATLSVDSYNPATSGSYRVQLLTIGYNDAEDTTPDTTQAPDDLSEYESDGVQINS